ncbi:hypothetical protein BDB01DRAFT_803775 [Pilobolus umbonatus]|nr:hypothetical protein BDB01DRAFT_803775 [Pilobolus umbonatus]
MPEEIVVEPTCQGCAGCIEEGAVVAFGDSLFHVDCFVCAKCKECVDNKTNLILLDDGRPVCEKCSYNCVVCHQMIQDEAIMTGDKAYHPTCFQCVSCKVKITDLVYTQTAKGIYCTACHELRKAERLRKRNKLNNTSEQSDELRSTVQSGLTPPPETASSDSFLSSFSSFFDKDSNELDNLSGSLGANLLLESDTSSARNHINRASEILESSLQHSMRQSQFIPKTDVSTSSVNRLNTELSEMRTRLEEVEEDYNKLQKASKEALAEFTKVKDDLLREEKLQKKQGWVIASLLSKKTNNLSKKELDRTALIKGEMDRMCKELISYRDLMIKEIDDTVNNQCSYLVNYPKHLKTQIKSLTIERDGLMNETKNLRRTRDELLNEISTKCIQLGPDTQDYLSIRGKDNLLLSPSQSSDSANITISVPTMPIVPQRPRRPSDASSVMDECASLKTDSSPAFFRIKKKGSTMFNKLGVNNKTSPKPEPSYSSSSFFGKSNTLYNQTNSSISSLATLSSSTFHESPMATSLGRNLVMKNKFMDSSASIHPFHHHNHSFQNISIIMPVKCGACNDKIWGRSEYRCDCCQLTVHGRCLDHVSAPCIASSSYLDSVSTHDDLILSPSTSSSTSFVSMFGQDLSERVKMENRSIPLLVEKCVEAVEKRALDYEGIYRKSGGATLIRTIQIAFDHDDPINLCDEQEINDIGSVTSVLKQYFRELPNPLLCYEAYDTFMEAAAMKHSDTKLEMISNALSKLPIAHQHTLSYLFRHLVRVSEEAGENKMSIKNLAMVFAPTLMRHTDPSRDFLDISYKNATIEYLLTHTAELFTTAVDQS